MFDSEANIFGIWYLGVWQERVLSLYAGTAKRLECRHAELLFSPVCPIPRKPYATLGLV